MKTKIVSLFLSSAIVLIVGTSVAYYNTRVYGFDKNASIFSLDSDKVKLYDYEIYYNDINYYIYNTFNKMADLAPKSSFIY